MRNEGHLRIFSEDRLSVANGDPTEQQSYRDCDDHSAGCVHEPGPLQTSTGYAWHIVPTFVAATIITRC